MKQYKLRDAKGHFLGTIPATARQNPEIGYKAFTEDLSCKFFHYAVGETYKLEGRPSLCRKGYHYCLKLSDTTNYYGLVRGNRYCLVAGWGMRLEGDPQSDDSKRCTNNIKILKELTLEEVIDILVEEAKKDSGTWRPYASSYDVLHISSVQSLYLHNSVIEVYADHGSQLQVSGHHNVVLYRDPRFSGQLVVLDGHGNFLYSVSAGTNVLLKNASQRAVLKGAYSTVVTQYHDNLVELHGIGSNAIVHGDCIVRAPGCSVTMLRADCRLKAVPGTIVIMYDTAVKEPSVPCVPCCEKRYVAVLDDKIDPNRWYTRADFMGMVK